MEDANRLEVADSQNQSLLDTFDCMICHELAVDPVISPCEHIACRACMDGWHNVQDDVRCPLCRQPAPWQRPLSGPLKNLYTSIKYKCPNEARGCKETLTAERMERHRKEECPYELKKCPYCDIEKISKEMTPHLLKCKRRLILCKECGENYPFADRYKHSLSCTAAIVKCPSGCGLRLKRGDVEAHEKSDCPEVEVHCRFSGCDATFKRKDEKTHVKEAVAEHLLALQKDHQELAVRHAECDTKRKKLEDRLAATEKELRTVAGGPRFFDVPFPSFAGDDSEEGDSATFTYRGLTFVLSAQNGTVCPGWLSLFLRTAGESAQTSMLAARNEEYRFSLETLGPGGEEGFPLVQRVQNEWRPLAELADGWGWEQTLQGSQLQRTLNRFPDKILKVRVWIETRPAQPRESVEAAWCASGSGLRLPSLNAMGAPIAPPLGSLGGLGSAAPLQPQPPPSLQQQTQTGPGQNNQSPLNVNVSPILQWGSLGPLHPFPPPSSSGTGPLFAPAFGS